MPDLSSQILPKILQHKIEGLPLGDDFIMPHYEGLSLVNIPGTITKLLEAPEFGKPPLDEAIIDQLNGPYEKVVLLLVDAMDINLFQKMMSGEMDLFWGHHSDRAIYSPITSICPSTTASALSTLWTGEGPATHGIIGYEMWTKEFGMIINNIQHSPASARGDTGGLERSGFDPNEFIRKPLLGTHLRNNGVQPTTFIHSRIANSGLSMMHMEDVEVHTFVDEADLCISLADHINSRRGIREYIYVYYSDVDTLMHRFSANDARVSMQFEAFSSLFEKALMNNLSQTSAEDVLLITIADHGSIATPKNLRYDLANHPDLMDNFVMQPTCENRLAFFYIKPGKFEAVQNYFSDTWPDEFILLESDVALEQGLFGDRPFNKDIRDRVGNLVAVAKGDAYLWWAPKPNPMAGRHGGLSKEEMLVPFYALPLRYLRS
jgi:hypothetical protein